VLVANPRKTRLIYSNKRKTDEIDAQNLARLARLDPKLLYPLKHRGVSTPRLIWPSSARVKRWSGAVRSWSTTSVEQSSLLVLACPSVPGQELPQQSTLAHIPEPLWAALGPILEQIGLL
jgi:transposase